jgi:hypothetical protein
MIDVANSECYEHGRRTGHLFAVGCPYELRGAANLEGESR